MSQGQSNNSGSMFSHWQQDFASSLVVFLVALPLCMGIALASGAPVATGLVTGIVGGLIVGFLAGAPLQVSGPAAGLTVVCAEVIRLHGIPALGIVVLIAGCLQLIAGIFRLGQWFRAVSPAVVHGMLSGIGVLILASQFHVLVDDHPHGNGLANLMAIPESIRKGLPLPEWEAPEVRRSRIEILQSLGKLHERQDEVERAVLRAVTQHGSDALHKSEEQTLSSFAPQQGAVLDDLRAEIARVENSPLAQNGETGERLRASLADAEHAITAALADVQDHRLETAEETQHAASVALDDVMSQLKSHPWAMKVGVLAVVIVAAWNYFARGKFKLVPAPLLAVLVTALLAYSLSIPVLYVEVPDRLDNGLTFPSWTVFEDASFRDLFTLGITMAAIASAETLLCAGAVDRMHNGPRTKYDRELAAQGIGNMICGCLGALPMTGVIVRSAANVHAGAKTRLSAILHGAWLLIFVLLLASVLRMIPVATLAGILVYTGFKLIDFKGFVRMWKESRSEAFIFFVTLSIVVADDLLHGVITGVVLSALKLLITFSQLQVRLDTGITRHGKDRAVLEMEGAATFLRLPVLAAALEKVPHDTELHVDCHRLEYIDHACLELLGSWARQHESNGGRLIIDWGEIHARLRGPRRHAVIEEKATSTAA